MTHNTLPIEIETLTPVHIGSGHELRGNYEYLYFADEKCIAVIDAEKILDFIGIDNIDNWVAAIDQQLNILHHLPQLRNAKALDLAQRIISIPGKAPIAERNGIKAHIHLAEQQPTIPGSSLKGAIRTAILTYLIKSDAGFAQDERNLGSNKGTYTQYHAKQIEANYFGREDRLNRFDELEQSPNKDLLRFLRVGDAYFPAHTCVVKNTIINLFRHGWGEKKEESSFYECIPKGAKTLSSIQIPQELLTQVERKGYIRNGHFELLAPQRLFKLINQHTRLLLQNEIDFWEDEDNPLAIGDYLDHFSELLKQLDGCDEYSCIIRVGGSSGWDFMTGAWSAGKDFMGDDILTYETWVQLKRALRRPKNYPDNVVFPKTRKMVDGGEPIGFIKLKLKN